MSLYYIAQYYSETGCCCAVKKLRLVCCLVVTARVVWCFDWLVRNKHNLEAGEKNGGIHTIFMFYVFQVIQVVTKNLAILKFSCERRVGPIPLNLRAAPQLESNQTFHGVDLFFIHSKLCENVLSYQICNLETVVQISLRNPRNSA